jgi:hypothetical protein
MFTTEGPTFSTRSVKSGKPLTNALEDCANAAPEGMIAQAATKALLKTAVAAAWDQFFLLTKTSS